MAPLGHSLVLGSPVEIETKKLAAQANKKTWEFLARNDRTAEEDLAMVTQAYASLALWENIGNDLHRARGHWLVARVLIVLAESILAAGHVDLCEKFTTLAGSAGLAKDFDYAYVAEARARVLALGGEREKALEQLRKAETLGLAIADPEEKAIFDGDLLSGPWYRLRG